MPTFGNTNIGANSQTVGWGQKTASQFTAPEDGTITDMSIYSRHDDPGNKVTAAVYSDSGSDTPAALLGYVTRTDIPGDNVYRWNDFTGFNIEITEGQKYWLCLHHDSTYGMIRYAAETCNNRINGSDNHPPDDPFGSGTDSSSIKLSIYATYTTGGAIYTKTWATDTLFKKLGIQKSLNVDTVFQKRGNPKTFSLDAAFQKNFTTQKQIGALFKRNDIPKSFVVDACFGALATHTIARQIDVVLKKLAAAKTFGLDVYFGAVEGETYSVTFGLSARFAYKVRLPELWLDENGKLVLNVSKPYTWVGT
jgi:hypothetical protein